MLLTVEALQTFYGKSHVLRDISFTVPAEGITVLLGRNGAGKTTTLRSIMGLTCVVGSLAVCRAVVRSPFGRALEAIRENERRFTSLGRDPRPFKLVVFVIAATFAGLAGALFAPFRGFASPEVMFWVFSGQGLMMVIMGGLGTLVGPILGAMVFILIQEVLSSYTEHWMIFTGAVFVLMVIFLPGGLVGTVRRLRARA